SWPRVQQKSSSADPEEDFANGRTRKRYGEGDVSGGDSIAPLGDSLAPAGDSAAAAGVDVSVVVVSVVVAGVAVAAGLSAG
ncbi:MAG: hypothetical protein IRY93_10995, partial [Chthoniobacterales bacterium]|nr:hypothetical protein [Chthoniobacterales bacterium]